MVLSLLKFHRFQYNKRIIADVILNRSIHSHLLSNAPPETTPRRVVVTGLGMVTPLGSNVSTTWNNLIQSKSGIKVKYRE